MSLSNRFCDDIDVQVTSSNVIGGSDSSLKSGPSFYIFLKNGDEKYKLVSAQMQKHTQKKTVLWKCWWHCSVAKFYGLKQMELSLQLNVIWLFKRRENSKFSSGKQIDLWWKHRNMFQLRMVLRLMTDVFTVTQRTAALCERSRNAALSFLFVSVDVFSIPEMKRWTTASLQSTCRDERRQRRPRFRCLSCAQEDPEHNHQSVIFTFQSEAESNPLTQAEQQHLSWKWIKIKDRQTYDWQTVVLLSSVINLYKLKVWFSSGNGSKGVLFKLVRLNWNTIMPPRGILPPGNI